MVTAQQQLNPIKATLWLKLDEQHISSGINKTYNYGRSQEVPHEIQVGDGTTAATFPLCASPKGFEFSDGYYLSPNIDLGTEWSISFHVNYNGANNEYIVGFSTGGGILLNDNAATNYLTYYDGTSRVSAGAALGRDRPYHVCVTKSAANSVKIYIDGILKATAPGTVGNTVLTRIGCSKDNTFYSHAVLLNFEAFKYELNSTQVVSLKNRLSRENITGGTSLFNPVMIPGCILYGGAYLEARATRGAQPVPDDWDMETAGVARWTASASATLSKQGSAYAGLQCLRVANAGLANRYAYQSTVGITGNRYRLTGAARGDGSAQPKIGLGSTGYEWSGTTSNTWQPISGDYTWTASGGLFLYAIGADTKYAEFDSLTLHNLSLTSYTPAYTTVAGSVLAQATPTAQPWVSSDGLGIRYQGGDFMEWTAPSSAVKCLHDGSGGTLIVAVRASVLNGTNRFSVTFGGAAIGAGIGVALKYTNANTIGVEVSNGSGTLDLDASGAATVAIDTTYVFTLRIASGANGVTMRQNGVNKVTGTLTAPSAANPSTGLRIGSGVNPASASLDGIAGHPFVANRVLTDAECTAVENYILAQATL